MEGCLQFRGARKVVSPGFGISWQKVGVAWWGTDEPEPGPYFWSGATTSGSVSNNHMLLICVYDMSLAAVWRQQDTHVHMSVASECHTTMHAAPKQSHAHLPSSDVSSVIAWCSAHLWAHCAHSTLDLGAYNSCVTVSFQAFSFLGCKKKRCFIFYAWKASFRHCHTVIF